MVQLHPAPPNESFMTVRTILTVFCYTFTMKKTSDTAPWGLGYYAEGARGSTGPTGGERVRLDAVRPEIMRKLEKSFATRALDLTKSSRDDSTSEPEELSSKP